MVRTVAAVLMSVGLVAGCGSAGSPGLQSGQWSYIDDRGVTVTKPERPKRIIAQVSAAGALTDFGVKVVGTFGPLKRADGSTDPEAGSVNPAEVTDLTGPGYGEVKIEQLAALQPEVLVSGKYPDYPGLWHLTEDQEKAVKPFVSTLGVLHSGIGLPESIRRYRELARALGGDVDSAKAKADEQAFTAAAQRLRELGTKLKTAGRRILAIGGSQEQFYVAVPAKAADLDYYVKDLGLPITTPGKPDQQGGYFESLSWEHSAAYPADVLMWDTRKASVPPEQMKRNPVFATLPAVVKNSFVEWNAVAPMSYASYAKIMTKLADQIESVTK